MKILRPPQYAHFFQHGQPESRWPELDSSEPLSKLYAKYRGKSINKDENKG